MKALLFLSYPITLPQHGGQLRAAAEKKALQDAGLEAASVSVFDSSHYKDCAPTDFAVPSALFAYYYKDRPWDLTLSEVIKNNPDLRPKFVQTMRKQNADAYMFIQPWLWPLVREIIKTDPDLKRPIIYSSQNLEFDLLRGMLQKASGGTLTDHDNWLLEYTYQLERELIEASELVIACTQNDLNAYNAQFHVKKGVVFPNGINPPSPTSDEVRALYAKRYEGKNLAAFVGSAHPPNAEGFETLFGENLGYLPPDDKIAVIGGVCDLIYNRSRENLFVAVNDSRCEYLGRQPQEHLDAILAQSKVITLPILTGGGSNLKTAEALVSGKTILSTSLAFRGYDAFRDFPTVNIVDDPREWRAKLRDLLSSDHLPVLTPEQKKATEALLWKNILKDYGKMVTSVLN